jgi:hypothetical protein
MTGRWAAAAAILTAFGSPPSFAEAPAPPPLKVVLKPEAEAGTIDRLDVWMRIPAPDVPAGGTLLRMPVNIVSTPTAAYDSSAIVARDDNGGLKLSQVEESPTPTGTYRHWTVGRPTVGDVVVTYGTPPRQVNSETRNGPLFDLRAQSGGLLGAGVYFFALPENDTKYAISVHWDLSHAPPGTRGISSAGEGDTQVIAPADSLRFSFYAVGPVKSEPASGKGDFGLYWLTTPPFDIDRLATSIHTLYDYMSRFFGDEGTPYRVFIRANPYPAGGGTSLSHSFMFGFGSDGTTIADGPQMLIAHEMAHTWPTLDGGEHAETAWYTEGTAEYYSAVLSERSGAIDLEKFLSVINDHATGYYTNPYIARTNTEAGALFWKDANAQRVPYGRGFMYLAAVDAKMRAKYGGKRSLDDLVLEALNRQRKGEKFGLQQWVDLVVRELGPGARQDYEDMVKGKMIVPPANAFGPCFTVVNEQQRPFILGFDDMRLGVVKNLLPGSPAAEAGVREGDTIVALTPLSEVRDEPAKAMELTLRRDGREIKVSYLPRGSPVPAWHWVRNAKVPDSKCRV